MMPTLAPRRRSRLRDSWTAPRRGPQPRLDDRHRGRRAHPPPVRWRLRSIYRRVQPIDQSAPRIYCYSRLICCTVKRICLVQPWISMIRRRVFRGRARTTCRARSACPRPESVTSRLNITRGRRRRLPGRALDVALRRKRSYLSPAVPCPRSLAVPVSIPLSPQLPAWGGRGMGTGTGQSAGTGKDRRTTAERSEGRRAGGQKRERKAPANVC